MSSWNVKYVNAGMNITREDKDVLQALADAAGMRLSVYLRKLAEQHIKQARKSA